MLKLGIGVLGIAVLIGTIFFIRAQFDPNPGFENQATSGGAQMQDGAQVVNMEVTSFDYRPADLTVKQGVPVKWVIDGSGASGCTQFLIARDFGISQRIVRGENIIEFTPTQKGTFPFSCSMNMARGTITVV
jgi:plastocyanin domain-containing protein